MKQLLVLLVLFSFFPGIALFAAGNQEREVFTGESIEITGRIEQQIGQRPEIVSQNERYQLMYPLHTRLPEEISIKQGDIITVEGYLVPGPRWESNEIKYLGVEKAIIAGEEYTIFRGRYDGVRGPRGHFPGKGHAGSRRP